MIYYSLATSLLADIAIPVYAVLVFKKKEQIIFERRSRCLQKLLTEADKEGLKINKNGQNAGYP